MGPGHIEERLSWDDRRDLGTHRGSREDRFPSDNRGLQNGHNQKAKLCGDSGLGSQHFRSRGRGIESLDYIVRVCFCR